MRRRSISYLINADVFQWKYSSDTGHRWISNPHNIHKLYISSISSSSRTAPSARSNFSSSSRVKGSARSNSIISSFEQGRPVRCSTRTRLDSTRKPSLIIIQEVKAEIDRMCAPGRARLSAGTGCIRPFTEEVF